MGELRSLFPSASVLALSATCSNKIRTRVLKVLNLIEKDTTTVSMSPNKPNIKLAVKKIDNHVESAMYWLIDGLSHLKETFPRTLIYCNSISDASKLYNYVVGEIDECTKFVDMFHSETPEENKELIISALREKDSEKRVIFATSALGMGIDVVDCNSIVLYGPPRTVVDLVQLVGRVGRDGGQSIALVLHNSHNIRSVDKDMKKLISCKTCRRTELMGNFLSETDLLELCNMTGLHTCCDLCEDLCCCGQCKVKLFSNQWINDSDSDSDTIDYEDVTDQPDEHDIDNLDDEFYLSEIFYSFETTDVE